MNRLFVIKMESREIRGLVSPGELPELVSGFYKMSESRGASADYLGDGLFIAERSEAKLTLKVGDYHDSIPSRMILDELEDAMEQVFN